MKIVIIGSGNVASHIAPALHRAGHNIVQIFSPTPEHAQTLAAVTGSDAISDIRNIDTTAQCYIYSVLDDVLPSVIGAMPALPNAVHLHTAGSMDINLFEGYQQRYGVLYPMQTFSKNVEVDLCTTPFFIEGNDQQTQDTALQLARQLSHRVICATTAQRTQLHIGAVFASNFTNHLYAMCHDILDAAGLPFDVMLPLIDATAKKIHTLEPHKAQTGPAARHDKKVIEKHIAALTNDTQKKIYKLLSDSIEQSAE